MRFSSRLFLAAMTLLIAMHSAAIAAATPPAQPASGPGGADYRHGHVDVQSFGAGADQYWVFLPAAPAADLAPLIVFTHGWGAMEPAAYRAWIDHIVRKGAIVVFPRYQADLRTSPSEFLTNAVGALRDAVSRLDAGSFGVSLAPGMTAYVGHSVGGILAANLAAVATKQNLPGPRAVMSVEPGKTWGPERAQVPLVELSGIPAGTLLLAVIGDRDRLVGDRDAKRIFQESTAVARADKNYVVMRSDDHGVPPLIANHLVAVAPIGNGMVRTAPPSGEEQGGVLRGRLREIWRERRAERDPPAGDEPPRGTIDALDYYGTWKLFDGLTDAAFYGRNRNYALGNTPEQIFMGLWSDGTPVTPLEIVDQP